MQSHTPRMGDLGEKAFLRGLLAGLSVDPRFVNGFGHDASVIDMGIPDVNIVMKIDRAAKPVSSLSGWSDFRVWGRIAVTANCSDILAVGGKPVAFMLSVSVDMNTSAQAVTEIVNGAAQECDERGLAFLGGDTKEARGMNVVGTAIGTIAKGRHFDRHCGRPGDLLVLAGTVGGFLGGYWQCRAEAQPPAEAVRYLSYPEAAWREGAALAAVEGIMSACDLSDGLASAARAVVGSDAGALIEFDELPFHSLARESAEMRGVDILPYAFGVGDWGILYAGDPSSRLSIERLRASGLAISIVGTIVEPSGVYLRRAGLFALSAPENEHFRPRLEDRGNYLEVHEARVVATPIKGLTI